MTIGTVCSGIGAPEVAFDAEPLWVSEIEKFPSAVLAHHYPDVPNLGDFTTDEAQQYMVDNPPDVFVGGTPCQAFSVAGKRGSLDDDRGNLTLAFVEVWHRLRTAGTKYCVWENVPGVLNTKDNAFGCFLAGVVGANNTVTVDGRWTPSGVVSGPEGVIAWRTLDAQHFGVPQRRRRIFAVIGHPGDFSVTKILLKPESMFGDTEASRETGQDATTGVGEGFTASSHACYKRGVGTVRASGGDLGGGSETLATVYENHPNDSRVKGPLEVCEQLTARNGTGGGNLPLGQEAGKYWNGDDVAATQDASLLAKQQCMPEKNRLNCVLEPIPIHDQATRHSGKRGSNQDGKGNGLGVGNEGDPMNTVTSGDKHAVAFNWQSGGDVRHNPSASGTDALTAHQTPAVGIDSMCNPSDEGIGAIPSSGNGQSSNGSVYAGMQVRRLTPNECLRLQGFPDNWTKIPWRNKQAEQCPDGPQYKAIGNSMAIPCVKFIADRIKEQL